MNGAETTDTGREPADLAKLTCAVLYPQTRKKRKNMYVSSILYCFTFPLVLLRENHFSFHKSL